jgi:hypothetical protein
LAGVECGGVWETGGVCGIVVGRLAGWFCYESLGCWSMSELDWVVRVASKYYAETAKVYARYLNWMGGILPTAGNNSGRFGEGNEWLFG